MAKKSEFANSFLSKLADKMKSAAGTVMLLPIGTAEYTDDDDISVLIEVRVNGMSMEDKSTLMAVVEPVAGHGVMHVKATRLLDNKPDAINDHLRRRARKEFSDNHSIVRHGTITRSRDNMVEALSVLLDTPENYNNSLGNPAVVDLVETLQAISFKTWNQYEIVGLYDNVLNLAFGIMSVDEFEAEHSETLAAAREKKESDKK